MLKKSRVTKVVRIGSRLLLDIVTNTNSLDLLSLKLSPPVCNLQSAAVILAAVMSM